MKTMTMIVAALIASGSFATAAMAQDTKHTLTGQEKTMRYQQDQREKMWNQERLRSGRVTTSNSYGMPNRQNPADRAQPENASPSSFSVPGSGAAFYNYDPNNKSWAYGY